MHGLGMQKVRRLVLVRMVMLKLNAFGLSTHLFWLKIRTVIFWSLKKLHVRGLLFLKCDTEKTRNKPFESHYFVLLVFMGKTERKLSKARLETRSQLHIVTPVVMVVFMRTQPVSQPFVHCQPEQTKQLQQHVRFIPKKLEPQIGGWSVDFYRLIRPQFLIQTQLLPQLYN